MKVILTHGYFLHEDPKEAKIMRPYPPLGLLYIAAWLDKSGIENAVFDSTFAAKEDLKAYLLAEKPSYLGVYVNLMTKLNALEIIRFVKETMPQTRVFVGGPDVRYNAENLLRTGADFVVIGEGEETTQELLQHLEGDGSELAEITGLAYLNVEGKMQTNPERTKIRDLDSLPMPARHKIDMQAYIDTWKNHHGQSAMTVSTMRGCPYTCKWCSRAVYGLSYRRRSPKLVAQELKFIRDTFNPDTIWMVDDVFTVNPKWMREFRDALQEAEVQIPYECISRADRLNEEMIQILKETGCFRVWVGAESGSQKIIDAMDRRVSVEKTREMIQLAQREGIQAGTFIMLGYPGETEEDIQETIHHLKVSDPDLFTITVAYPIRGTELYEEVKDVQISAPEWATSTDRDIDFERTFPRKYYDYAVAHVISSVNLHKMRKRGQGLRPGAAKWWASNLRARAGMWWVRQTQKAPTHS